MPDSICSTSTGLEVALRSSRISEWRTQGNIQGGRERGRAPLKEGWWVGGSRGGGGHLGGEVPKAPRKFLV